MEFVLFFFVITTEFNLVSKYLKDLLHAESPKDCLSHVLILGGLTYPFRYLDERQYFRLIISICIMDSFAAIVGTYLGSKGRTIYGSIGGQTAAWITEYVFFGTVDIPYHVTMGFVEFFSPWIDNLTLAVSSVVYQRGVPLIINVFK